MELGKLKYLARNCRQKRGQSLRGQKSVHEFGKSRDTPSAISSMGKRRVHYRSPQRQLLSEKMPTEVESSGKTCSQLIDTLHGKCNSKFP